jgi:mannose-6-phosphate isomerase
LFGNYKTDDFPLLVKLIHAKDDLSIQVHPDDEYAQEVEKIPFGKYES